MKPSDFVKQFYTFARETEVKTGISAIFILAQAAHESAYGAAAPQNMFFGKKDSDGLNGNEQLIKTTEYSQKMDLKFPEIISITPCVRNGLPYYKYVVRDYFRKYATPEESFTDHAQFFFRNKRYKYALPVKGFPRDFAQAIAEAGYATDPNYATLLIAMIDKIEKLIPVEVINAGSSVGYRG
jgi:flagellar protein FlgJ